MNNASKALTDLSDEIKAKRNEILKDEISAAEFNKRQESAKIEYEKSVIEFKRALDQLIYYKSLFIFKGEIIPSDVEYIIEQYEINSPNTIYYYIKEN